MNLLFSGVRSLGTQTDPEILQEKSTLKPNADHHDHPVLTSHVLSPAISAVNVAATRRKPGKAEETPKNTSTRIRSKTMGNKETMFDEKPPLKRTKSSTYSPKELAEVKKALQVCLI